MELTRSMPQTALAFRGYNITNLGRTPELLAHPAYGPVLQKHLKRSGELCAEVLGRPVELAARVAERREAGLEDYAEAIAIIAAAELAQVEIAQQLHGLDLGRANCALGYSLGELIAASVAGVCEADAVLRVPLALAADCAELAEDTTMGIVFSRGTQLDIAKIRAFCEELTCEGEGTIALSAILSPNTLLLLGQGKTLARFKHRVTEVFSQRVNVRINEHRWPPLHTPIVRQRNVPDRAAVMIERVPLNPERPAIPLLSLVTGRPAYTDGQTRTLLRDWVDHPQRLWDVVNQILSRDVRQVIHIGPEPNVVPATFHRLAENVRQLTGDWSIGSLGMRAVQQMANRRWLASLLPSQGNLLRASSIEHIVLEDWLLENDP